MACSVGALRGCSRLVSSVIYGIPHADAFTGNFPMTIVPHGMRRALRTMICHGKEVRRWGMSHIDVSEGKHQGHALYRVNEIITDLSREQTQTRVS